MTTSLKSDAICPTGVDCKTSLCYPTGLVRRIVPKGLASRWLCCVGPMTLNGLTQQRGHLRSPHFYPSSVKVFKEKWGRFLPTYLPTYLVVMNVEKNLLGGFRCTNRNNVKFEYPFNKGIHSLIIMVWYIGALRKE